ncbi:MAG: hypothetical protein ACR2OR_02545 [Hyphomicrobiales bacterium]
MKNFTKVLFCNIAIILSVIGTSQAAPSDTSCNFVKGVLTNSTQAQSTALQKLTTHWVPESRQQILKNMNENVFSKMKFVGGRVFSTLSLANDLSEHLAILRKEKGGIVIFALHYVWYPGGPRVEALFSINSAQVASKGSTAQVVSCS